MSSSTATNDSTESQRKIVEQILAARTLYEVLGVDASKLDPSTLRKAYLTTSVKVHPDKNPHPEATAAFQRVAEAWNTLSDASSRAAYDEELRNPTQQDNFMSSGNGGTQYAYDFERTNMPTFQEALFVFAAATSMFAGNSGTRSGAALNAAGDFMETLFWAQKLAQGRQRDTQNTDFDSTGAESVGQAAASNPMASGMALGSGLRAVAATQRMMGFKNGAAATERAAQTVQMAAVGATVLQAASEVPAVRRTLERGKEAFQNNPHIGNGIRASLKFAGNLVHSLQEAQKEAQKQQSESPDMKNNL